MTTVYIVKSATVVDDEGMEVDTIRYVTMDVEKAEDFVCVYGVKEFMWIDEYTLDEGDPTKMVTHEY